ncbi:MAG: hypothetical protein AVDCRST_MAG72-2286, partial [uncultured Nocardioidaceae bacterium]
CTAVACTSCSSTQRLTWPTPNWTSGQRRWEGSPLPSTAHRSPSSRRSGPVRSWRTNGCATAPLASTSTSRPTTPRPKWLGSKGSVRWRWGSTTAACTCATPLSWSSAWFRCRARTSRSRRRSGT